jgi:CheY-like chemotaxis protein
VSKPILIVDDDDDLRSALAELLALEGFTVKTVRGGVEALESLAKDPLPALILLDLMMPWMSGREFAERQREDPRIAAIPVVVLSASHDVRKVGLEVGAVAALSKPIDVEALLGILRRFC